MSEPEITITMPKALLKKWLTALRSGKLRQATGTMLNSSTGAMCCLGVLQYVAGGNTKTAIERERLAGERPKPLEVPSMGWLENHGVCFMYEQNKSNNPGLPSLQEEADASAAGANDSTLMGGRHKYGFKKIADLIERHAKGI